MVHVRIHCEDFDALFEMARHSSRSIAEGSRWRQFVECHIVLNLPPQHRRQMFLKWLELVKNRTFGDEHLAEICDLVIQPVLKQQFMQPSAELMVSETSKSDPNQSQGNLIGIAVQTLIGDEIINKVADVLRVSILKLLVLFTEHGENYFPQPKTTHSVMLARFAYVACTFLQRKERDHIQVDVGTIFQSQNLLAQVGSLNYSVVKITTCHCYTHCWISSLWAPVWIISHCPWRDEKKPTTRADARNRLFMGKKFMG